MINHNTTSKKHCFQPNLTHFTAAIAEVSKNTFSSYKRKVLRVQVTLPLQIHIDHEHAKTSYAGCCIKQKIRKTAWLVLTLYQHASDKLPTSYRHINWQPTVGCLLAYRSPTDGQQGSSSSQLPAQTNTTPYKDELKVTAFRVHSEDKKGKKFKLGVSKSSKIVSMENHLLHLW